MKKTLREITGKKELLMVIEKDGEIKDWVVRNWEDDKSEFELIRELNIVSVKKFLGYLGVKDEILSIDYSGVVYTVKPLKDDPVFLSQPNVYVIAPNGWN